MTETISAAIVGTRGIPNNYGGFEEFAQHLATGLTDRGHHVVVYNPHFHAFDEDSYYGAVIVKQWCPEQFMGPFAHYIYDYLCLRDAVKRGVQTVLVCGYTSSAPGLLTLRRRGSAIVLNMDGIEWRRAKWGNLTSRLLRRSERVCARSADYLVADNDGIATYLQREYDLDSVVIPYGATIPETIDRGVLSGYGLGPEEYYLAIARLEPENNIEMMLDGFLASDSEKPFCVVGNHETRYGSYLKRRYQSSRIRYLGGIYNTPILNSLRHFAALYFHGHSVGGTNPSLLDAMACRALICANDNIFNRSVLGSDAYYFSSVTDVARCIAYERAYAKERDQLAEANLDKIRTAYSWNSIVDGYEKMFRQVAEHMDPGKQNRVTRMKSAKR